MRYFDTSSLCKIYLLEAETPQAQRLFASSPVPPPFTHLHGLEVRCAFRQRAGRGEISEQECAILIATVRSDFTGGGYSNPPVNWPVVFAEAESLSGAHGIATLCRSFDTLHVALAVVLGATEFCTFDQRQARMALAANLTVLP